MILPAESFVAAYTKIEKVINGAQYRMLRQLEGKGWPVSRTATLDEFNGIRRTVFEGFAELCLTTTRSLSSGSSAN